MAQKISKKVFFHPETFAKTFLWILDKDKQKVRLVYKRAQREFMNSWGTKDLVLKARQLGISTAIQGELFRSAITTTATTITLCHDDTTTQKMRRMADRFYNNLPEDFRPERGFNNNRITSYPEFDSEALIATAGNVQIGRGDTYSHIHGSEVAFWPDAESIVTGAMQGGHPRVVLESTPNGAQGYFYETCMEAIDGKNDWHLHFIPWWLDDDYQKPLEPGEEFILSEEERDLVARVIETYGVTLSVEQLNWRRGKQNDLKSKFIQEYPEDPHTCFLQSGLGYFGDLDSGNIFSAPHGATPQPGHSYYMGLDFGQINDYTTGWVLDATTYKQVDMLHVNKESWADMRQKAFEMAHKWQVKRFVGEKNSMGSTNMEELQKLFDAPKDRNGKALDSWDCEVIFFEMSNPSKNRIMANLHEALHEGNLKMINEPYMKAEFNGFVGKMSSGNRWILQAKNDKTHDDTVIAAALALEAFLDTTIELEVGEAPELLNDPRAGGW